MRGRSLQLEPKTVSPKTHARHRQTVRQAHTRVAQLRTDALVTKPVQAVNPKIVSVLRGRIQGADLTLKRYLQARGGGSGERTGRAVRSSGAESGSRYGALSLRPFDLRKLRRATGSNGSAAGSGGLPNLLPPGPLPYQAQQPVTIVTVTWATLLAAAMNLLSSVLRPPPVPSLRP